MKSFTGIIFWSILLICSACTDENETNNGKRTDCYNGTPLTVRATATGFENVLGSEKPSTRASVTDEHLKTEFVDGDSIGIFSIKDGTIVDDINNIPLVYNVSMIVGIRLKTARHSIGMMERVTSHTIHIGRISH